MPTAEAMVEDRRSFIRTPQLRLRKGQFLRLTRRTFLVNAWKGVFFVLGGQNLRSRQFLAEFRREVVGR
jgi:hypothetical protein